jgi:hypothetical protein
MSTTPQDDGGNIDAAGASSRRRAGVAMLAIAAATYIGLIVPPDLDRRWLIASAAPCVAGIFCVMQSYQVPGTHPLSPPFCLQAQTSFKNCILIAWFQSCWLGAAISGSEEVEGRMTPVLNAVKVSAQVWNWHLNNAGIGTRHMWKLSSRRVLQRLRALKMTLQALLLAAAVCAAAIAPAVLLR